MVKKKTKKCKHLIDNKLCGLTKNWDRTFDDEGEPLDEYGYEYCHPDTCILKQKKPKEQKTNEIVILKVRQPLERIEYAYDKMVKMFNEGKVELKEKDQPFFLGYLMTIKIAFEEMKRG